MEQLLAFDQWLYGLINGVGHHPWLDAVLVPWRHRDNWLWLYAALAVWLIYRFRLRGLYAVLAVGLTVGIADQLSSNVIKPAVERARPCRTDGLHTPGRTLVHCGGGYSFPSSHAANHFALAVVLFATAGRWWRRWRWLLIGWAFLVAYAQVYVGVHFPVDALAGALLGTALALLAAIPINRYLLPTQVV